MERRLAAILAVDVVGYSRLMGEDEIGTLARLKTCRRELIDPAIAEFHGRIVKLMGDGALVQFASVVDAIQCAVTVQRTMTSYDQAIPEARRIRLRIGINLGDVIVDGDDLYGDGVNIAARLEALAEPGGISLSGTAFDQAIHKVDAGFFFVGEQRVKNIADPVRVYRVLLDPAMAGKVVAASYKPDARLLIPGIAATLLAAAVAAAIYFWNGLASPERPSLAVLPFANLSGDPKEAYFADGITEDLITDLAKLSGLDVIARNSVFAYKNQQVDLKDIARDLDVRYVVEGSVRRAGDQIRINTQLVDTATNDHVWAERFDRNATEVFTVEDEVIRQIIKALGVQPTASEANQLTRLPTANLEAYDYYLRGEQAARTGLRPQLREALEFYQKATALDPSFANAYAADARTSVFVWRNTYDDVLPGPVARKRAYEMASRALELNPQLSLPYTVLSVLQVVDGQYDQALTSARRAVALGPGDADAHVALGLVLTSAGQHPQAAAAIDTALRLDPNLSAADRQVAGLVFLLSGNTAGAINILEQARTDAPGVDDIHSLLAAAYAIADRLDEARAAVAEALRLSPPVSVAGYRLSLLHLRSSHDLENILAALRKAGLPEWPYSFQGEDQNRLRSEDISRLALGRTLQGRIEPGSPAIMQISRDGKMAFRSASQLITGTAFVDREKLCEQSENVALGRPNCGPVYRRSGADKLAYTYVNAVKVFHFSPVD